MGWHKLSKQGGAMELRPGAKSTPQRHLTIFEVSNDSIKKSKTWS